MRNKVRQAVEDAMADRGLIAEPYDVPAKINGHKPKLRSIKQNLVYIQEYDPIAFLTKIMVEGTCPYKSIDEEGNEHIEYVDVKVNERVKIGMFLTGKLLPSVHLVKAMSDEDMPEEKDGFEALVDEAISRGKTKRST